MHPIFFESSPTGLTTPAMPAETGSYLFYPANSWRHKNHQGLLDALLKLKEQSGLGIPLILSGQLLHGEYNHCDILRETRLRGLESQVFHLGLVPIANLKQLYANAAALIFPSLFEGFGLPLAEAMSCGCPIIASRRSSIPEIAGEAALYFNPDDPSDIAAKIRHFFDNPGESERRVQIGKKMPVVDDALHLLDGRFQVRTIGNLQRGCGRHPRGGRIGRGTWHPAGPSEGPGGGHGSFHGRCIDTSHRTGPRVVCITWRDTRTAKWCTQSRS